MPTIAVSTIETPEDTSIIANTVSNRAPLLASPIAKLPLGSILAHGWIGHQLKLMTEGMVGRLLDLSRYLADDNGWLGGEGDGWEEQPYWLRGFYDLGVLTGDKRIQGESSRWIEAAIASQDEDGYFGPKVMKSIKGANGRTICDLWGHMVMIDALRSHWEATGDERIPSLLTRFFRFCADLPEDQFVPPNKGGYEDWRPFVQHPRSGDMLPHIYWLYNLTGEDWLLDLATRFHDHVSKPDSEWLCVHVVNFTQRFREPGNYYAQSHDPAHLDETERWYEMHMGTWGQQPGGAFGADENLRPGKTDPKQAIETCAMTEFNKSSYILGQITGQTIYADRTEDIIFNSFPASQDPELKGLHYLTAANQPQLDASENHDYSNKCRQLDYSPRTYRCCQHNVAMGWPYYVEHLWMAAAGDGLVAWMYGPCEVKAKVAGAEVKIVEETDYPFDTSVKMTISADRDVEFPLYLRVPGWCDGFTAKVNGQPVDQIPASGQYLLIERTWRNGDVIRIEMPVRVSVKTWGKSGGSVTVNRGPLSYSLKIGEDWRQAPTGIENWPDWEVFPTTPWNYGLVFDPNDIEGSFQVVEKGRVADQPWTLDDAPIEIRASGKRISNWTMIDETVTDLQKSPIKSDAPVEEITLVPMGCARLRMSCLPVIGEGPDAHEWVRVQSHEEAMQLRLGQK